MFVEVEYEWTITVEPDCLRSPLHLKQAVLMKLMKDFEERKCTAEGYLISPTTLEHIGEERIWERSGLLAFPVRFRCVVFTLMKGEFVLAVARKISNSEIMCECGPVDKLFIPDSRMNNYRYVVNSMPGKDGKGGSSNGASVAHWEHSNGKTINVGDVLRVRIEGTKWETAKLEFNAVGTLNQEHAGRDDRFPDPNARPKDNTAACDDFGGDDEGAWGGGGDNEGAWGGGGGGDGDGDNWGGGGGNGDWGGAPDATDDHGQWDD